MRYVPLLFASLFLSSSLFAQPSAETVGSDSSGIVKTEYVRLESLQKDHVHIFSGDRGSVRFNFVELRNISTDETLRGVEVTIEKEDRQRTGSSLAFAAVGSMWGVSSSATYERIQNSGYIFLSPENIEEIVGFLNEVIGATGRDHDKMKHFKVSLQEGFELGMRYDPEKARGNPETRSRDRPEWEFLVSASDATYTLSYQDGVEVVRKLGEWNSQMENETTTASE